MAESKTTTMTDVWAMAPASPQLVDFLDQPRKWRALTVTPTKEKLAADWLKNAKQWVYWPNYTKQVPVGTGRRAGRGARRPVMCAVVPGYLFLAVHVESGDPWQVVHMTPGVHGFIRDGTGHAASLADRDIEIIRHIEAGLNLPYDPKTAHRHKPRDKVRFVDDVGGNWPPGIVDRLADDGRIVVLVPMLGRMVPVLAYPHQIEAM